MKFLRFFSSRGSMPPRLPVEYGINYFSSTASVGVGGLFKCVINMRVQRKLKASSRTKREIFFFYFFFFSLCCE